jgi:hypothetical protein
MAYRMEDWKPFDMIQKLFINPGKWAFILLPDIQPKLDTPSYTCYMDWERTIVNGSNGARQIILLIT